jgi:beta-barrel assembly-enhancing protease
MQSGGIKIRLIIGLIMAAVAAFSYFTKSQVNPVTGEVQHIDMTPDQEVAMGLQSAPQMAQEYGGEVENAEVRDLVNRVGGKLFQATEAKNSPYNFQFHPLADPETINAFALPGGQVFITMGLLKRLKSEDQLAGVLGHEMGHVINRHSAEQMAKTSFVQGLVGAVTAATSDPYSGMSAGQIAQYVAEAKLMKFSRNDELEADEYGVKYLLQAGYNPEEMIAVMEVLKQASGGKRQDDFMSSHPNPDNRIEKIREAIAKYRGQSK